MQHSQNSITCVKIIVRVFFCEYECVKMCKGRNNATCVENTVWQLCVKCVKIATLRKLVTCVNNTKSKMCVKMLV